MAQQSLKQNSSQSLPKLSLYEVARAIEEDRVALAFQPIVHSRQREFVLFYEGLIRIYDYHGNLRNAADFIDMVEGTEVGNFIDQVALEIAIAELRMNPHKRVSVNMSTRTIWDEDWLFLLDGMGRTDRSVTERLIVEFTEHSVVENVDQMRGFMQHCRQYGVNFAIDDFGAGNTVLGYLRDFRFDFLKIDGSICQNIGHNVDNQVILKAILSIAKHFDMTTIAEWIDNDAAANKCQELGVDGLQGFLFGKGDVVRIETIRT